MSQGRLDSPIFITGIERSGSSIVAKIIHHCGGYVGGASEMYENFQIKKLLDIYYGFIGADIKGQRPLPNIEQLVMIKDWRQKVEEALLNDRLPKDQPWMIKGSRLCQIWPLWHEAFPDAKWIIVRRRPPDIIDSCLKTAYMVAYKDREGWLEWIHEHEKLFVGMIQAGVNCKVVWPERMASGDYKQMAETLEWLGLPWKNDIMSIVEPLLYRSKQRNKKGVENGI